MSDTLLPLLGGMLIGLAATLMAYWNGKIAGVSSILYGTFSGEREKSKIWRWTFLLGLFAGGLVLKVTVPESFAGQLLSETWTLVVSGILVGFGTTLGSGCTSGHGVCGISRWSKRSVAATVTFILAGVASVWFFKALGVLHE
ncbi:MAG: YeeE/YedE family protein [Bdellovibrionales bacterium]|nr:YeeE/YedE family protein [Bdellovibrionales bacterium]